MNDYPVEFYHYRHSDPTINYLIGPLYTPWDWMDEIDEEEDNPWLEDTSWLEEDLGDGYPDPNDW